MAHQRALVAEVQPWEFQVADLGVFLSIRPPASQWGVGPVWLQDHKLLQTHEPADPNFDEHAHVYHSILSAIKFHAVKSK